jgi:hypothetical protein
MATKRLPMPAAKPGQLIARWAKLDRHIGPDLCYSWGDGCDRTDSRLLHDTLTAPTPPPVFRPDEPWGPSFVEELEARGYDITTLRFSISKKV